VEVTVTTLDHLIATHGLPRFLKIDVEANELSTLRGLHHAVPAVMFEYQCPLMDQVAPMLDHLMTLGPYVFGLLNQDRITWGPRDALLQQVAGVCGSGAPRMTEVTRWAASRVAKSLGPLDGPPATESGTVSAGQSVGSAAVIAKRTTVGADRVGEDGDLILVH
jgi:hypothetical protein